MGMLYLLSNTTQAQIVQYSEDGTQSCIDCEGKNSETVESCYCTQTIHISLFDQHLNAQANHLKESWLRNQEAILKRTMDGNPNDNFNDVQDKYFKDNLTNEVVRVEGLLDNHFKSLYNYDEQTIDNVSLNANVLNIRVTDGVGTLNKYGDLKYNGKLLREMTDQEAKNLFDEQVGLVNGQHGGYVNYSKRRDQIDYALANNQFRDYLAQEYINHFNRSDYEDAIRFMTGYILSVNLNNPAVLDIQFGSNPNIYEPIKRNHTPALANLIANNPFDNNPPPYPTMSEDVALFRYALNNHIKIDDNWFNGREHLKSDLKKHLEMVRYYGHALTMHKRIFDQWILDRSYGSADINFTAENNTLVFQKETNQSLAMNVVFPEDTWTGISLRGYNNVLNSLFDNRIPRPEFEGEAIKDVFEDNSITIPTLTYDEIAAIFDVGRYDYPIIGPPQLPIVFSGTIGQTLWNAGLRFPDMLQYPYVIEGFQALARGETFDFAFRKKVYDLSNALSLNQAQTDWLVTHRSKTENLYNYYSTLNNAGTWSSDEAIFVTNAINVMMAKPDVNPLLGADCRSFEYAQPPGALQKACAVKDFDHRFYTAGIRPNGSPYLGDIEIPIDLIYFTAPNWMNNGQAANATAEAVTLAIKATDIYFYRNPDVTKFALADFFRDAIKTELAIFGGGITFSEPFPIPSPAPYITSVLGIGNPFDCE